MRARRRQVWTGGGAAALASVLMLLVLPPVARAAEGAANEVPPELWDRPRSGRAVLAVPAVKRALGELVAAPAAHLTIRHAPGVEASGQAEELRAWIVAHAIDAERVVLRSDLAARQPIRLDVAAPQARPADR